MPMAISMVGASLIWRFVYDYKETAPDQIGFVQPDPCGFGTKPFDYVRTDRGTRCSSSCPSGSKPGSQWWSCQRRSRTFPPTWSRRLVRTAPTRSRCSSGSPAVDPTGRPRCLHHDPHRNAEVFDIVCTMRAVTSAPASCPKKVVDQSIRYDEKGKGRRAGGVPLHTCCRSSMRFVRFVARGWESRSAPSLPRAAVSLVGRPTTLAGRIRKGNRAAGGRRLSHPSRCSGPSRPSGCWCRWIRAQI